MIPILYSAIEENFTSNGLGRLSDAIRVEITEERNGIYELELDYPIDGVHYSEIQEGRYISTTHDEQGDRQPFKIYAHTAPMDGIVTFRAHHISYELTHVILKPFTATSIADAFDLFETETFTPQPFTFWTDKTSSGTFRINVPTSNKAALGGVEGSILDAFGGGDYEFDMYTVRLYAHRGADNGVTIRYGKNLLDITDEHDALDLYNAVIPFWEGADGEAVHGSLVLGSGGIMLSDYWTEGAAVRMTDENGEEFTFTYSITRAVPMDLSTYFDEAPTPDQLDARALQIIEANEPWNPKRNITVDFTALWQQDEYANIAPLERVRLCDVVTVIHTELGVDVKMQVIRTVYDALREKYTEIELGDAKTSFADVLMAETDEKLADVPSISMMDDAIDAATSLITGGMGGHVLFMYDADGKPTEILVMDTEDAATAVNVLRINVNGIGFSHNGVNGPFTTAWTLSGSFVADFITAGTLSANRIRGGVLSVGGQGNGAGRIEVFANDGTYIGTISNGGFESFWGYTAVDSLGHSIIDINGSIVHFQYYTWTPSGGRHITEIGSFQISLSRFVFRGDCDLSVRFDNIYIWTEQDVTIMAGGVLSFQDSTTASAVALSTILAAVTKVGTGSIANVGADISAAIGNTALGTTATTLSGAIEEIRTKVGNGSISNVGTSISAAIGNTRIANVGASLSAAIGNTALTTTATTLSGAIKELKTTLDTAVQSGTNGSLPRIKKIYYSTASNNRFVMFEPTSGTTYYCSVSASSDARLKTNIKDSKEDGLGAINKIRHVSFDWIADNRHEKNGYVAQELEKINPEFVSCLKDKGSDTYVVNQYEILTYATKAIQELSAKVDALEARVRELEEGK